MTGPRRFMIQTTVEVSDPGAVLAYARKKAVQWGMSEEDFEGEGGLALAVRESIILNHIDMGPDAIGMEIVGDETWEGA